MLRFHPLAGSFAAEVSSFDLGRLTKAGQRCLRDALHEHLLLIFKDQSLSFDDQANLTAVFGEIDETVPPADRPFRHPDDSRIQVVNNDRRGPTQTTATVFWHIDQSFRRNPSPVIVLKAVVVPPAGGATMFANLRAAYDALTPDDRASIAGLKARHCFGALLGLTTVGQSRGVVQPIVRRHPVTGRRSLYLNQFCIQSIDGLSRQGAADLLGRLYTHAVKPEFVYSHNWTPGDVLVWDNASLMHRAASAPSALRVLHRTHTRRY
jgi:alpha-ketoglutarate-dependent taurine dioxygenase